MSCPEAAAKPAGGTKDWSYLPSLQPFVFDAVVESAVCELTPGLIRVSQSTIWQPLAVGA